MGSAVERERGAADDRRRLTADALVLSTLLLAVTAFFADVLFLGRAFYLNDLFRYHFGMKRIVRDAMLSGEVLWHDAFGGGQPLAANPAFELFYPPQWLILIPDFILGTTLHIVVHFFIAAIGMYALLRSMRAMRAASAAGTIAFVLGGPLMSLVRVLPFLFSVAWMPLIFLFARRALETRSPRDVALAAFFGGMQALVGEPVTLLQTWAIVGGYALWKRQLLPFFTMGLGAFLIAAAQLIPAIDFSRDSVRSRALPWNVVSTLSMPFSRVLELFYPVDNRGETFIASMYIGACIGLLALAGLLARKRGWIFTAAVLGGLFVLALGANTPLLHFLYDVGLFRSLRYPEKFAIGAMVVAIVWGALMLDRFLRGDEELRTWTLRVAIGWAVLAMFFFSIGVVMRIAIVFAVLFAMRRKPRLAWGAVIAVLMIADVFSMRGALNPTMPRRYYDRPAVATQLPNDARVLHFVEWQWAYGSPGADQYFGDESRRWWAIRNAMLPRSAAGWGITTVLDPDYDATYLEPTEDLIESMREMMAMRVPHWQAPLLAMSNVGFIGRLKPFVPADPQQSQPVEFSANPVALPRFYFAERVETIATRHDFVRHLVSGSATPRTAFIEGASFTPAPGDVHRASQTPGSIALDVTARGRALLVLSVTPHRYWRATIDGAPARLIAANIGYQALEVAPGRHTIALTYANPLIMPSIIVSVIAAIAALIVAIPSRA